jgi:hypothetical protein
MASPFYLLSALASNNLIPLVVAEDVLTGSADCR